VDDVDRRLEQVIDRLLDGRRPDASICPSDAARDLDAEGRRELMPAARAAAGRLAAAGSVEVTQGGSVVDVATAVRGPDLALSRPASSEGRRTPRLLDGHRATGGASAARAEAAREAARGGAMTAIGSYRFALRPDTGEADFEAAMSRLDGENVLQLTRVTSAFEDRLLAVVPWPIDGDTPRHPRPQYVWEVTVFLVTGGSRYDFAGSADRVQRAVGDLATLISVESYRPVTDAAD